MTVSPASHPKGKCHACWVPLGLGKDTVHSSDVASAHLLGDTEGCQGSVGPGEGKGPQQARVLPKRPAAVHAIRNALWGWR